MEIKEIDGKQFIEYDKHKAQKKKMIIQVAFIVAIIISSAVIIFAVKSILDTKDMIGRDPLSYGMDQHGFISCQCFDSKSVEWYSNGEGFISQQQVGLQFRGEFDGPG